MSGPAALVLEAAVHRDGPSPALRRPTLHAAGLCHRGDIAWLVPCAGLGRRQPTEAAAIRVEDRSTNTGEKVLLALPIRRGLGCGPVVVVTD